ncbi:MAG: class I SAM-dependent methyltransferase [Phycisphaeraceae bacterium]
MRETIKWWLFPGLNLHARLRGQTLPAYFGQPVNGEERRVLDAGCGNGMLAYHSYLKGNTVLGVSIKEGEVVRNRTLFHKHLGVPSDRLNFEVQNLYDLDEREDKFDEIICTEVLEHIVNDAAVCRSFYDLLKPGGILHVCCPNADHPDHKTGPIDEHETGGHVRDGYTEESYRKLLEPLGFEIEEIRGLGGPVRQTINKRITNAQRFGFLAGAAVYAATRPMHNMDGTAEPKLGYSLYVRAKKA